MRGRAIRRMAPLILWLGLTLTATAQALPEWQSPTLNDFAGLLTPEDASAVTAALEGLRQQTGIEGTVVTLPNRASYGGSDGLEAFATRLFNHWGVGDARRNDGFMLLVLDRDREARIELGRGYPGDADILAQEIMRNTMLPAFRDGRMSRGIRDGTEAVITLIARPTAAGQPVQAPQQGLSGRLAPWLFGGGALLILGGIGRQAWRRRHCPQCGKSGIETSRAPQQTALPDGGHLVSDLAITRRCPHCGWSDTRLTPQQQILYYGAAGELLRQERNPAWRAGPGSSSGGFGGGSSRGGGASGRW